MPTHQSSSFPRNSLKISALCLYITASLTPGQLPLQNNFPALVSKPILPSPKSSAFSHCLWVRLCRRAFLITAGCSLSRSSKCRVVLDQGFSPQTHFIIIECMTPCTEWVSEFIELTHRIGRPYLMSVDALFSFLNIVNSDFLRTLTCTPIKGTRI